MADVRSLVRRTWVLPTVACVIWWLVRWVVVGKVSSETGIVLGSLLHFGLLTLVVSTFDFQHDVPESFLLQLKRNLQPAVLFAVLAAANVGMFHHVIASDSTAFRRLERERFIEEQLADEEAFAALQEADPQLAGMDVETARARALEGLRFQFNPLWHVTASLLTLLLTALTTGFFVTFMSRFLRA